MGIFDKVKKLFKKKEDKKEKDLLEEEIEKIEIEPEEEVETESKQEGETESEQEGETEPEQEGKTELELETESEQEGKTELELETESEQEGETEPEQEGKTELELETESEQEGKTELELETESEQEGETEPESEKEKLDTGLKRTKESFFGKLARTVAGKSTIDELALDDIEEVLISSDIGVETTLKIIEKLEERVERDKYINTSELNSFLKEEISSLMKDSYEAIPDVNGPYVIMVVGVNGVGKTTTIGKLAHQFKQTGKKVVLGAADTFRAAAVDQLVIWAERVGVEIIKQEMGSDPASVCFDTLQSAKASDADVVIIDTAGRLHNKVNLMNELTKIKNVMAKIIPKAPHDVMLVLDASTGQNAIEQATQFTKATDVDSITLTKLDGTAKGGVVIGISDQFNIPVRYIGVGEGMNDLQEFNKQEFVDSLFN